MDKEKYHLLLGIRRQRKYSGKRAVLLLLSSFLSLASGIYLSAIIFPVKSFTTLGLWFAAQLILALGIFQSFLLIHEAGHQTLFKNKSINKITGLICSLFCFIPFYPWQFIHSKHHRWTGWKDVDPTTSKALKRELPFYQEFILDKAWMFWIPVFCPIYVLDNFWNLPRLFKLTSSKSMHLKFVLSILIILSFWIIVCNLTSFFFILHTYGLAFLFVLFISDPLMLSQHSHIPQELSQGNPVKPFSFYEQDVFTRSLRFPDWVSKYILYGFDRHEAHHVLPSIPGYQLPYIELKTENDIAALRWLKLAKTIPGHKLVFLTREETGIWL
ncbi:MAG TPA: fatty acid desaturase [Oligoflexia bacterium]|nr:fatty acid desaturase [Oligoflexia bacterium]HMP47613.1 fatty acid desaturase [Oligoflexia bacterium]